MSKCSIRFPEEFLLKVSKLGDRTDEIVKEALKVGGDIMYKSVKSHLQTVIGKDLKQKKRSTGELLSSLGVTPDDLDDNGVRNVKVGFNEPRLHQYETKGARSYYYYDITNAMIANVLEYGKSGQPAKPFLKPARNKSRKACVQAMEKTIESEISKL
ncbi:MAG: HK97 gp10 family phage protein [Treponema sp.]|nr:HK97 gp10 family phage protein [Treponema sp.]